MLLCGEDDDKLQIAAAGALAMITAAEKKLCTKMTLVVRSAMMSGARLVGLFCSYNPMSFTNRIIVFFQQTAQWLEILQRLCLHTNPMIQHRGLVVIYNMLNSDDGELAKKLMESELLEILTVIGKAEDNPKRQEAIDVARTCLVKAMDLGLIKPFTGPS